jgi:trimeric autotransporter adhesin
MSIQSVSFWQQDQNYWNQNQSFYQQDQNYWTQAQAQSQASSADAALINSMGAAETNKAKGLASIANQTALNRVNSQISALVQQVLQSSSSGSASSSSTGTTGSSSAAPSNSAGSSTPSVTAATGTGTVPVTTATPLSNLGILAGGSITISAGANTTTYTSTGSDTVGDLINAINVDLPTNANVTASLNGHGQLVITSRDTTDTISIGGTYASNIGFGVGNNTFSPVTKSSAASSASASAKSSSTSSTSSATSASTGSSAASSTSKSSKTTTVLPNYLALSEQGVSTAAGVLTADGVSGSLVDLLA